MNFPPPTEKQARLIWRALTGVAMAAVVALIAVLLWGMGKVIQALSPVLWPVAVAAVLALLLDPLVDFFQRKGLTRARAIFAVFSLAFLISGAVCGLLVPKLVGETRQFIKGVPDIVVGLENSLSRLATNAPPLLRRLLGNPSDYRAAPSPTTNAPPISLTATNADSGTLRPGPLESALDERTLQSAKSRLAEALPEIGAWFFGQLGTWLGVIIGLALVPIYAFYFLTERYKIEETWTDYLPVTDSRFKTELVFFLRALKNYLVAFFRGQVLVALCEGILYTIGFLAIGLPYGLLLGASAAVLTIVPFLGIREPLFQVVQFLTVHRCDIHLIVLYRHTRVKAQATGRHAVICHSFQVMVQYGSYSG